MFKVVGIRRQYRDGEQITVSCSYNDVEAIAYRVEHVRTKMVYGPESYSDLDEATTAMHLYNQIFMAGEEHVRSELRTILGI